MLCFLCVSLVWCSVHAEADIVFSCNVFMSHKRERESVSLFAVFLDV